MKYLEIQNECSAAVTLYWNMVEYCSYHQQKQMSKCQFCLIHYIFLYSVCMSPQSRETWYLSYGGLAYVTKHNDFQQMNFILFYLSIVLHSSTPISSINRIIREKRSLSSKELNFTIDQMIITDIYRISCLIAIEYFLF